MRGRIRATAFALDQGDGIEDDFHRDLIAHRGIHPKVVEIAVRPIVAGIVLDEGGAFTIHARD
jgi:hypothetical protein